MGKRKDEQLSPAYPGPRLLARRVQGTANKLLWVERNSSGTLEFRRMASEQCLTSWRKTLCKQRCDDLCERRRQLHGIRVQIHDQWLRNSSTDGIVRGQCARKY